MMPFIMITCKKATFLVSKKEENKLSFGERIQLKMHLAICKLCRLFEKQSWLFSKHAQHMHEHSDQRLSIKKKEEIKTALGNLK